MTSRQTSAPPTSSRVDEALCGGPESSSNVLPDIEDPSQLIDILIKLLIQRFPSADACVISLDRERSAFKWSASDENRDDLVAAAQLARRSPSPVTASSRDTSTIAIAVPNSESPCGGLAVSLKDLDIATASVIDELHIVGQWFVALLDRFSANTTIKPNEYRWFDSLFAQLPLRERAAVLCQSLVDADHADRIALGLSRWGRMHLLGLSGERQIARRSPLGHHLNHSFRDAMSVWRQSEQPMPIVGDHGKSLTIPLRANGVIIGSLYLDKTTGSQFTPDKIAALMRFCDKLGPVIEVVTRAERDPLKRLTTLLELTNGSQASKRRHWRYWGIAGLMLAVLMPTTHRIASDAYVEGEQQRAIVAPMHSYLKTVEVTAGEQVVEGQLLAKFAVEDLVLEKLKWQSERARLQKEKRDAAARQERAKLRVLDAEISEASAEIALVDSKLARHEIRAPADGVIVSGDLTQHLGAPVERGEVLFEIVPDGEYQLTLRVDEQDVRNVQAGMWGHLKLNAFPRQTFAFELSRITPVNEISPEGNHFLAHGRLIDPPQSLQPGMRGIAKTEIGTRPAIVNWSESLRRWISLKLWAWWG